MSVPFQRVIAFYWKNETFSLLWQTQTRVLNIFAPNFPPRSGPPNISFPYIWPISPFSGAPTANLPISTADRYPPFSGRSPPFSGADRKSAHLHHRTELPPFPADLPHFPADLLPLPAPIRDLCQSPPLTELSTSFADWALNFRRRSISARLQGIHFYFLLLSIFDLLPLLLLTWRHHNR
jgi:hypothetical protein